MWKRGTEDEASFWRPLLRCMFIQCEMVSRGLLFDQESQERDGNPRECKEQVGEGVPFLYSVYRALSSSLAVCILSTHLPRRDKLPNSQSAKGRSTGKGCTQRTPRVCIIPLRRIGQRYRADSTVEMGGAGMLGCVQGGPAPPFLFGHDITSRLQCVLFGIDTLSTHIK